MKNDGRWGDLYGFRPLSRKMITKFPFNLHSLGECAELILFWDALAEFQPSGGSTQLKMLVSDQNLEKLITQSTLNLAYTFI